MVCKFCGAVLEDGAKFCSTCGNAVEAVTNDVQQTQVNDNNIPQPQVNQEYAPQPQYAPQPAPQYQQSANQPAGGYYQNPAPVQPKPNNDKKKLIVIVAVVAVVLVAVAVALIVGLFALSSTDDAPAVVETETVMVSEDDAKQAFNTLMADYGNASYPFIYCTSVEDIKANKLNHLCDDIGTFYSWTAYAGDLTNGTLKASDIMTQEEYDKIIKSGAQTWSVFKSADVQARLDGIFGKDKYKVADILSATSMVTASGYLLYDEEPVAIPDVLYYGGVVTCTNNAGEYVIEANVVKCDNASQKVYDEATGIELCAGAVTAGTDVNFDSVVSGLQINKSLLGKITVTYSVVGETLVLKSVTKPAPAANSGSVSAVVTQAAPQISGEVISIASYGRYVKAGGGLNIRALPSTYASKVANIPNGAYVSVIGKSPYYSDWVYVSYSGYNGWVNANYLVTYKPTTSYSGGFYATVRAGGGLNIRNSPGGYKIGNAPNGSSVYVYYYNDAGTWAYINYAGVCGWVSSSYIY